MKKLSWSIANWKHYQDNILIDEFSNYILNLKSKFIPSTMLLQIENKHQQRMQGINDNIYKNLFNAWISIIAIVNALWNFFKSALNQQFITQLITGRRSPVSHISFPNIFYSANCSKRNRTEKRILSFAVNK